MKKRPLLIPDLVQSPLRRELFLAGALVLIASIFYLEFHFFRLFPTPVSTNEVSLVGASYFWETGRILNIPFSWIAFFMTLGVLYLILRLRLSELRVAYSSPSLLRTTPPHLAALALYLVFLFVLPSLSISYYAVLVLWYLLLTFLLVSVSFVFLGDSYSLFYRRFWKELLLSLVLGVFFFATFHFIQNIWPYLSLVVAQIVFFGISRLYPETAFYTPSSTFEGVFYENVPTVGAENFAGVIFKTCSGIEGLSLFLFLFTIMVFIDWSRIQKWKLLVLYPLGMLTMFAINNLRIFLLIVAGIKISPGFASGGFHSNIGWILFTIVFILFELLSYRWMVKK